MSKLGVILLIVSICLTSFTPANGTAGFLGRFKNGLHKPIETRVVEKVVVVEQPPPCSPPQCGVVIEEPPPPRPCKSRKCRPKPVYVELCRTQQCNSCRNECYGNDACQNNCITVEKCRNNCNGNYICIEECGGSHIGPVATVPAPQYYQPVQVAPVTPIQTVPVHFVEPVNRCQSCPPGCGIYADPVDLDECETGKTLNFVQVPKTVTLNDIVSNSELLNLYRNSSLELDENGISGRVCLTDKARSEFIRLNASIQPVNDIKK